MVYRKYFAYIMPHKNTWKVHAAILLDNEFEINLLRITQLNRGVGIRIQVTLTLESELSTSRENCFPISKLYRQGPQVFPDVLSLYLAKQQLTIVPKLLGVLYLWKCMVCELRFFLLNF